MKKYGIAIPLMVLSLSLAVVSCRGNPPSIPPPSSDIELDTEPSTDPNAPPGIGTDSNALPGSDLSGEPGFEQVPDPQDEFDKESPGAEDDESAEEGEVDI